MVVESIWVVDGFKIEVMKYNGVDAWRTIYESSWEFVALGVKIC